MNCLNGFCIEATDGKYSSSFVLSGFQSSLIYHVDSRGHRKSSHLNLVMKSYFQGNFQTQIKFDLLLPKPKTTTVRGPTLYS